MGEVHFYDRERENFSLSPLNQNTLCHTSNAKGKEERANFSLSPLDQNTLCNTSNAKGKEVISNHNFESGVSFLEVV